jgi:anti-sigma factor RsiW
MGCELERRDLDLYLDGELDAARVGDLAAHLRSCSACAREVLERVQLKRAVQTAGRRFAPSEALRKRISRQVSVRSKWGKGWNWGWRLAFFPALLVLLATALLNSYLGRERADGGVISELADLHVATLASATLVDVISSDRHTVKPWFQGRVPFSFNLPDLAGTDFTLLGGRIFYLEQNPGAHLIYQLRKHEISVFILQDRVSGAHEVSSGPAKEAAFEMESWSKDGLRYFVIGDAGPNDIRALSQLLAE